MSKKLVPTSPIFTLKDAFEFGKGKGLEIHEQISGRYAGQHYDWGVLAEMTKWAGNGDHLEIGTLFGGSAILSALTKIKYGLTGNIVCIDPLDGYYGNKIDPGSNVAVTPEIVRKNFELFNVQDRIELVTKKSQPWPLSPDRKFNSAYIDGQHDYKACLSDWLNCKKCVDKVIQFDNHDMSHAAICNVVSQASKDEWLAVHISGISAIVAKRSWLWPDWEKRQLW